MKRLWLYIICGFVAATAAAGDEITVLDWHALRIDSLLPVYSEVIPLESNYRDYDYRVSVQYPEWGDLNERELRVVHRYADSLGTTLQIHWRVGVSRKVGVLDIHFFPIIRRGKGYRKLLSGKLVITPIPKRRGIQRMPARVSERYTRESKLATGRWVKISVKEDGIYSLSPALLQRMGFTDPGKVHIYGQGGYRLAEVSNPALEIDDIQEIPLYKQGENLLFWANGLVYWEGYRRIFNPYANEASYFVTEENRDNGAFVESAYEGEVLRNFTTKQEHVLYEKDEFAWFHGGRNLYESVDFANSNGRSYKLTAPQYVGDGLLTISFTAGAKTPTKVSPMVNGHGLDAFKIDALSEHVSGVESIKTYDVHTYHTGDEWDIRLSTTSGNPAHLDYLAFHYTRQLSPLHGFITFGNESAQPAQYCILGSGMQVMRIPSATTSGAILSGREQGGKFFVKVSDASHRYVAFDPSYKFPSPTVIGTIENQNLHAMDSLDMVIIIPQSGKLAAQAQRLADAHKQYDGLRVAVVRADQIYNEFSSGTPDATAYRRFMKMLYDRAEDDATAPKYLLLMGDCAWDNRLLSAPWRNHRQEDLLLSFQSENSLSGVLSYVMEDYFGLLDDTEGARLTDDKVDLGIGRFPVSTEAEAKILVDKSIAHMANRYAGSWKNVVCFIGDDGDQKLHQTHADDIAQSVILNYPELEVRKIMFDAYPRVSTPTHNSYPVISTLLKQQMKEGALVMNYTGHAAPYTLSHEFVLQLEDFEHFKSTHLPLWVGAACDVMPFDGLNNNIGRAAVLNEGGAAVGFFSTARTVYAENNLHLNKWFMRYLFAGDSNGRRYAVGDAIRMAKTNLISRGLEVFYRQNKLHYALLGDPALVFGMPVNRIVLDSINAQSVGESIQLKAGQQVCLRGHVQDAQGRVLDGMNGILSARVYDNIETIVGLDNTNESAPFTFTSHSKVLFSGQDSLSHGYFTMNFVMPNDINFSDQRGRIVFYAVSNDKHIEANGYSEQFLVGSAIENSDTLGPKIHLYLNTENFENGGRVNASPCFFAFLEDESGISYSGNSLGHDLTLLIDNNPLTSYTLNDYYQGEFGDYKKGSLMFSIPPLPNGKHSLLFRAWDVLNNTSAQRLDFIVDSSLSPNLLSVTASQNPAISSTNFLITHDRAGSEVEILLEVFDFSGQRMYMYSDKQNSATGFSVIPWNLSSNGAGRLAAGIYLYRVTLRCGESKLVSKTQKIIIAGNK